MGDIDNDLNAVESTIEGTDMAGERVSPVTNHQNNGFLSAGELFEVILRHPDWRVVEAASSSDACHPLEQVYSPERMLFKYDGASRQMHHEGMCEDIIDRYGTDPMPDAAYRHPVLIQEMYGENWKSDSVHKVRKCTLDGSAKWIKLHPLNDK